MVAKNVDDTVAMVDVPIKEDCHCRGWMGCDVCGNGCGGEVDQTEAHGCTTCRMVSGRAYERYRRAA